MFQPFITKDPMHFLAHLLQMIIQKLKMTMKIIGLKNPIQSFHKIILIPTNQFQEKGGTMFTLPMVLIIPTKYSSKSTISYPTSSFLYSRKRHTNKYSSTKSNTIILNPTRCGNIHCQSLYKLSWIQVIKHKAFSSHMMN